MGYLIAIRTFLTNHLWPNYDIKYKSLIMLIDYCFFQPSVGRAPDTNVSTNNR